MKFEIKCFPFTLWLCILGVNVCCLWNGSLKYLLYNWLPINIEKYIFSVDSVTAGAGAAPEGRNPAGVSSIGWL